MSYFWNSQLIVIFYQNVFVLVFSIPYETYEEHLIRLKSYSKLSIVY